MRFHRPAGDGATVGADGPVLPHFLQVDNWCGTKPLSHFLCLSIPQALMNTSPGSRWRTIGGTCGLPSSGRKTLTAAFSARPRGKTAAASAQVQHPHHHPAPAGVDPSNGSFVRLTSYSGFPPLLVDQLWGLKPAAAPPETFLIRALRIPDWAWSRHGRRYLLGSARPASA